MSVGTGADYRLDPRLARVLAVTAAAGALAFVAGALQIPDPATVAGLATPNARAWTGLLVGFHYVLALGLSGMVFLALLACSSSTWAAALRRIPEAMSRAIPVAAVPAAVLLFGIPTIFEWAQPHGGGVHDAVLDAKRAYLNPAFLAARTVLFLLVWTWMAARVRDARAGASRIRWGAAAMAVFGVTYSLTCVDWMQSLEPHWFSTAFALINLAGLGLSGLAGAIVLGVHLRRSGAWRGVLHADHLHDLAKLLFGFSLFWSYVQYSQYMLVWYTDMPEETVWYAARMDGMWWSTGLLSFVLNGVLPFVLLLFRRVRRSETGLLRVALLVLVGRVADLFFQIGPPLLGPSPWPAFWEVLPVLGLVALFALVTLRALASRSTVREGEPGLDASLHYHA